MTNRSVKAHVSEEAAVTLDVRGQRDAKGRQYAAEVAATIAARHEDLVSEAFPWRAA